MDRGRESDRQGRHGHGVALEGGCSDRSRHREDAAVTDLPPAGLSWAAYVARWVDDTGGWLPLADALISRARGRFEVPDDPQTVERGLRRLARREHKPGGQYGRWMLRLFGVTSPIEQWLRWLGTGHTRFADLPSGLRLEQLQLWNRPPVAETPLVAWIELGIAHAHHSRLDHEACEHWLARAEPRVAAAGPAAEVELALARVEMESDSRRSETAPPRLAFVDARLAALAPEDALPYRARLAIQRATLWTRPSAGTAPDIAAARSCYSAIPDSTIPFVACSRAIGLAYCAWTLGDAGEAARWATRAIDEAGDGGLVRMRVRALNMLSRVVEPARAAEINARAHRIATMLEDEELLRRVAQSAPR
jgi:hypothetical protein